MYGGSIGNLLFWSQPFDRISFLLARGMFPHWEVGDQKCNMCCSIILIKLVATTPMVSYINPTHSNHVLLDSTVVCCAIVLSPKGMEPRRYVMTPTL